MADRKLLTVVGTRPQFVKAAVISRAIPVMNRRQPDGLRLTEVLVHTGQHYDPNMSAVFFQELGIPSPAYQLGIGSGPHGQQTGRMLERLEGVMEAEKPDCVLVYGDTNSTVAGSLAASKLQIPSAHVEAGLRSYNRAMPEEVNRVIADHLAAFLFCPSPRAVKNLSCEGLVKGVHLVGDVMYDSLRYHLKKAERSAGILGKLGLEPRTYGLATVHRADTTGNAHTLRGLFDAFGRLGFPVIVPLHPRTAAVMSDASLPPGVRLIEPVSYYEMLVLERHARLILTDSGGVQKEAYLLQVPCVTLRTETEWVETVEAGWNHVAGTDPEAVVAAVEASLAEAPPQAGNPYGHGHAAEAILEILGRELTGHPA